MRCMQTEGREEEEEEEEKEEEEGPHQTKPTKL